MGALVDARLRCQRKSVDPMGASKYLLFSQRKQVRYGTNHGTRSLG
jgi:hypothetical protein